LTATKKTALITGITGQDGSYLADLLLAKGYRVVGLVRPETWYRENNASHLAGRVEILFGNMSEGVDIASAIQSAKPDEIYNLASQSRPGESWSRPSETLQVTGMAALRVLEAARHAAPGCRIYHASSSEMFGSAPAPQNEATPFVPMNPYAAAKVYAHQMARIYRESYGMFIACGILFNHESERRPLHFLPQKIAYGAACAALGIADSPDRNEVGRPIVEGGRLALGNMNVARDWGYAADFVEAMWLMLQADQPGDYVIGTGQLHTLQELCDAAYGSEGMDWRERVVSDPALARPLETGRIVADASRARQELGWEPRVDFAAMVQKMVQAQKRRLQRQLGART
jgi:GDPmannose 4,6-dehydratase